MNKKLLIFVVIFALIIIPLASATSWGTFKQGETITLVGNCPLVSCNQTNISIITYPNSTIAVKNQKATISNNIFNLTFSKTNSIGTYLVYGVSSNSSKSIYWERNFEITPSGFINTLGLYLVLLIVLGSIIILGFSINEAWFVVIGGLGLIMLGIYSINYGVVGFKDMFMTWGLGLFEVGVGAILSIGSAIQKMDYD